MANLFFLSSCALLALWWLVPATPPAKTLPSVLPIKPAPPVVEKVFSQASAPAKPIAPLPAKLSRTALPKPVADHSLPPRETEPENTNRRLVDNWDFAGTGLTAEGMAGFMGESQPEDVFFFGDDKLVQVKPLRPAEGRDQSERSLFLGTEKSIQTVAKERKARAEANAQTAKAEDKKSESMTALESGAYEIASYRAGKRDDGEPFIPLNADHAAAIQGPDYSFRRAAEDDEVAMRDIFSKVVTLGHGGELVIGVAENGFLVDGPGSDFTIFENGFRVKIDGRDITYFEYAYVGVSDSPQGPVRWFPCDPPANERLGCAGAVPTADGGDHFDLAEIGVKKARYIWIRDTGKNQNVKSRGKSWPTEGADIDALRLHHAYK